MKLLFKLFNSVKSAHEATEFARLELSALVGEVSPVGNVIDAVTSPEFGPFLRSAFSTEAGPLRLVDALTYELPYGRVHGYSATVEHEVDLDRLAARLAYTKEIYVVVDKGRGATKKRIHEVFPSALFGKNLLWIEERGKLLLRVITNQYFLEKSEYISRLSRDEGEVQANTETLLRYPNVDVYRVPASSTMRVGRRLEDWFAIREESSLYLTHYMYPYKGKFHPKMARALINYVCPEAKGRVLDNFAGSGTTLVEAVSVGLDGVGVEINPLSVLMSQAKCDCLESLSSQSLLAEYSTFRARVEEGLRVYAARRAGRGSLDSEFDVRSIRAEAEALKSRLSKYLPDDDSSIATVLIARNELSGKLGTPLGRFFMMVVGGTVSDITRRTSVDFLSAMDLRFHDLYLRVLLGEKLKAALRMSIGTSSALVGDNRELRTVTTVDGTLTYLADDSVQGIVNSPPYSTALDYVENDFPQLTLLKLGAPPDVLQSEMIGLPRTKSKEAETIVEALEKGSKPLDLTGFPGENVARLVQAGRRDMALRSAKFFLDMRRSLAEMYRVLAPGRKAAIVIGNNVYKAIDGTSVECENDRAILSIGESLGFSTDYVVSGRDLEKSSEGAIRSESILILKKPAAS